MAGPNKKLVAAVEAYFADRGRVRASGGATAERSYYPPLERLLRTVGATLKPKVFCVQEPADHGVGHPDLALYTASQVQRGRPSPGQVPGRGVVEVKGVGDDVRSTAVHEQVERYWGRYRLVLVTNLLSFQLVGAADSNGSAKLETFTLAEGVENFWRKVETPRAFAREVGARLGEYLARALSHRAVLAEPKDLAWLLASYARDGLARVEAAGYTPTEVVRYMVARVDKALKDDLGIAAGLAAENVYMLDPCCGTGAYLAEVLRRIAGNLGEQGLGALAGAAVRRAAAERVFGFEIMPAPFVVAHLQVGLTMQNLGAPLAEDGSERAGVFLTNALTGWEPRTTKPLPFPELEEERDLAESVKRDIPILVILGNPPYNGFAGMAVDEERELSEAYRTTNRVQEPTGQGLNDLYVRFFRMAERRIAEKTGRGVVCFISNYSWLDGLSFTGMRERYLEAFDAIRIDCLNGDKYKTGKVAPDGSPDPSIFSTEGDPVGIQVGTAIATLVRKVDHEPAEAVGFRHLWGQSKATELTATADAEADTLYSEVAPLLPLGLPFAEAAGSPDWFDWPALPDLFPVSFPGVKTSRDGFLVDTDLDRLRARVGDYFDPALSHEEIARRHPRVMKSTARFDAQAVRDALLRRGGPDESGFIRFAYRPFDTRWAYWEKETKLLDEKRADYRPHVFNGNRWLSSAQHLRKGAGEPQTCCTSDMGSLHLIERGALMFPAWLREEGLGASSGTDRRANLSGKAQRYLDRLSLGVEDLFHHVLATLHDPAYREANAGALRMEWPRIPLPGWQDREADGAAQALNLSAAHGRKLAALLDSEQAVLSGAEIPLRPEIAVPHTITGRYMAGEDFAVTAGWGHFGTGDAVMPGRGRIVERAYRPDERAALTEHLAVLGETTFDVYLNGEAFWRNVPSAVWDYRLGGYQVLKKWLSYRENTVLGRSLLPEEVQHFADTVRRIGALLITTSDRPERSSP